MHYHYWIYDTCIKVEFQIQILHNYYLSKTNSIHNISVKEINPKKYANKPHTSSFLHSTKMAKQRLTCKP